MPSLPKVTLLGDKGNTYSLGYGAKVYEFTAGVARKVSLPVALVARKVKDKKGNLIFSVEIPQDMTTNPPQPKKNKKRPKPKQNVAAAHSGQQTL
jgi:hypothetical protein